MFWSDPIESEEFMSSAESLIRLMSGLLKPTNNDGIEERVKFHPMEGCPKIREVIHSDSEPLF